VNAAVELNEAYIKEFEMTFQQTAEYTTRNRNRKQSIDDQLLDEIEQSMKELKQKIIYVYVDSVSNLTMAFIVLIFACLGYTVLKVNKMLNKSHLI